MKEFSLVLIGTLVSLFSMAQLNCDSLKCSELATADSYVILEETVVREAPVPIQNPMISCEMLCAIEEARSPIEDIIFYWGTLKILIYKEEENQK